MINYSNPVLLSLRKFGQEIGVLRPVVKLYRRIFNKSYEDNFDKQMMEAISVGDVVWDIGANIGFFTIKFAEIVGINGQVYAFEPSPATYNSLIGNCIGHENVTCKNIALSKKSGCLSFRESAIVNDPTNGLVEDETPNSIVVKVFTGDDLINAENVPVPNIVKIDVEGYELEVIDGMKQLLKNSALRYLFIEVHFYELNKRGLNTAVKEIVSDIVEANFTVNWADPSHIIASR